MAEMDRPVKIGIVGCGVIAQFHARALRDYPAAKLAAVADVREEVAHKMAAEFGVERVYTDPDELMRDDEIEGVVLALPANARRDRGLAAFAAGKHVLTEKPVAINAGEVKELIAAQGELLGACCSSRFRFTDTAKAAAEFLRSGRLGKLRLVRCRVVGPAGPPPASPPPPWRLSRSMNGGGIMANWGCYDLDFLLGILDWKLEPRTVLGQIYSFPPQFGPRLPDNSDAETHALGIVRCDEDITLSYERAEMYPGPASAAWDIVGEEGTLVISMVPSEGPQVSFQRAPAQGGLQEEIVLQDEGDYDMTHHGPVRNFAAAIRGREEPRTSLAKALTVAQITDGIYKSAATGKALEISEL